jgi:excisionase family DNA binding protein
MTILNQHVSASLRQTNKQALSHIPALAHSVSNAAAMIGISRSGLYTLIARGEIPIAKIGTRTLVLDDDLRAYLARHRIVANNPAAG